jgi:hypothetical protein
MEHKNKQGNRWRFNGFSVISGQGPV